MSELMSRRGLLAAGLAAAATTALVGPARAAGAHRFGFADIDGGTIRLAEWTGQPVLVVNTASRCGYTYQYDGLQALWQMYRDRGLIVLGVPSDDFGGQELDSEHEVKDFCAVNFAIDFPMTEITKVRGPDRHPFYSWAADEAGEGGTPRWNFHKILIAPDGHIAAGFPSAVEPMAPGLRQAIETMLPGDG